MAYDAGAIGLHSKIKIRMTREVEGELRSQLYVLSLIHI